MLLRFYINASSATEAKTITENTLQIIREVIVRKEYRSIERYWKIKRIYLVEVTLEIIDNNDKLNSFFKEVSDCWLKFGNPVEEMLATRNNKNSRYMKEKIEMLNIFFDCTEKIK